jgi:hypothetical protein
MDTQKKEDEIFYMRVCDRCNEYFFTTAKHGRVCEECLDPVYKKFFSQRGIKYLNYNQKSKLKEGRFIS